MNHSMCWNHSTLLCNSDKFRNPKLSACRIICSILQLHLCCMYLHFQGCRLRPLPAFTVLQVTVGNDTLTQVVQVANSKASDKPLKFTTALHTYFRVGDISQTQIEGLSGLKYLDNMQNRQQVIYLFVCPGGRADHDRDCSQT